MCQAARIGNFQGAAGVGGTVATPVLFKTDGSLDYYFRCLHVCLAWGIDVLNLSLSHVEDAEFWFPTTAEQQFPLRLRGRPDHGGSGRQQLRPYSRGPEYPAGHPHAGHDHRGGSGQPKNGVSVPVYSSIWVA
jgi:hypothetical protein